MNWFILYIMWGSATAKLSGFEHFLVQIAGFNRKKLNIKQMIGFHGFN